jgi:integrase
MARHRVHLSLRGGVFHWRARLPEAIARAAGRSHYARSLRTRDPREARFLAARLTSALALVDGMLTMPTPNPTQRIAQDEDLLRMLRAMFDQILERGELNRMARPAGFYPWTVDDNDSEEEQEVAENTTPFDKAVWWRSCLQRNMLDEIEPFVARMLAREGLLLPPQDARRLAFLRMALATTVEAHQLNGEREEGHYRPAVFPFDNGPTPAAQATPPIGPGPVRQTIQDAFRDYIREKVQLGWSDSQASKAEATLNLFIGLVGTLPFAEITKPDAKRFRDALFQLPALYSRHALYRGLSPQQCVDKAEAIRAALEASASDPLEAAGHQLTREEAKALVVHLHPKTMNNHIDSLGAFFNHAINVNGFVGPNPFKGLRLNAATAQTYNERNNRTAFRLKWPAPHLSRMFTAPLWSGCRSEARRWEPGTLIIEDGWWWAPLVALFNGLRLEETLQLRTDDIAEEDGLLVLKVCSQPWHRAKTNAARRVLPVHSELVRCGLLEFQAAARAAGSAVLFPEMPRTGKRWTLQNYFSKRFSTFRQRLEIPEQHDFHALRTTFDSALEGNVRSNTTMVRWLMGHSLANDMAKHYAQLDAYQFVPMVESARVRGLDLSHLHLANQPNRTRPFIIHPSRAAEAAGGRPERLPEPEPEGPQDDEGDED